MTAYACKSNEEELASAFIVSTCELIPKPSPVLVDHMHNLIPSICYEPKEYSIECGSSAEFYVRPLITCIDDKDNLIARTDELAFSGEFPVLPNDWSGLAETIRCYKIEPYYKHPGFVRLRILGEMNYNLNNNKYEFNYESDTNSYAVIFAADNVDKYTFTTNNRELKVNTISGPALACKHRYNNSFIGSDFVKSVWC